MNEVFVDTSGWVNFFIFLDRSGRDSGGGNCLNRG